MLTERFGSVSDCAAAGEAEQREREQTVRGARGSAGASRVRRHGHNVTYLARELERATAAAPAISTPSAASPTAMKAGTGGGPGPVTR